jgi:NAD-dependent SIR2 family protein deacetylase
MVTMTSTKQDFSAATAANGGSATTEQKETTDPNVDELAKRVQHFHIDPSTADAEKDETEKTKFTATKLPGGNRTNSVNHKKISPEIRRLAALIDKADSILILTGAGVSCAAGIPDFRTPGTGLYDNLQKYDLPFPEAVFELDFFRRKPLPFVCLAQALWPSNHTPTLTHSFWAMLAHSKKKLLRNYSQNIDGLEFLAGMPADHLLECHGHFRSSSCIDCRRVVADQSQVETDILVHARPTHCKHCSGLVKPDIVFFGEGLPDRFHKLVKKDTKKADLCIVMGTSLQVAPVSMIPDMVGCKVALVNREPVGTDVDLFCQGDCDDIIADLVQVLGWHEELELQHEEMVRKRKGQSEEASQR